MPTRRMARTISEPTPYGSDLDYIEAEMGWIEARCRRLALKCRLDVPPLQALRSHRFGEDQEPPGDLRRRLPGLRRREHDLRKGIDDRLSAARGSGTTVALDRLCSTWDLSPFERNVLLLALASTFSERFSDLFGGLLSDDGRGSSLTVEVAFAFCEIGFADRIRLRRVFCSSATFARNDIASLAIGGRLTDPGELLGARIVISPGTYGFLLGDEGLADEFQEFSSVEAPRANFEQVVLDEEVKRRILSVVRDHDRYLACRREWGFDDRIRYGRGILMLFHGPPGTGKTLSAHAVAHALGQRVLNVDVPSFVGNREASRFLPGLFREARLRNALLFFDECEGLFSDRRSGNEVMGQLLTELERFEGIAVMATNLPGALDPALMRRILVRVGFSSPDRAARREIWRRHLPPEAPLADDVDVDRLARHDLAGGYIKNAVLVAVAEAVQGGTAEPRISMEHLDKAAREQLASSVPGDGSRRRPAGFISGGDDREG